MAEVSRAALRTPSFIRAWKQVRHDQWTSSVQALLRIDQTEDARQLAAQAMAEEDEHLRHLAQSGLFLHVSPAYEREWMRSADALYADSREWLEPIRSAAALLARRHVGGLSPEQKVVSIIERRVDHLTRLVEGAGQVAVSVRDEGAGIAPDVIDSVFDLFTQAEQLLAQDRGGLGIGLSDVSGHEVARWLRADARLSPPLLVALTGYAREQDRRDVRAAGFDHHLVKAADCATLMNLVRTSRGRQTSGAVRL